MDELEAMHMSLASPRGGGGGGRGTPGKCGDFANV